MLAACVYLLWDSGITSARSDLFPYALANDKISQLPSSSQSLPVMLEYTTQYAHSGGT